MVREGNGNPLQYSCVEHPWMEEPRRLSFSDLAAAAAADMVAQLVKNLLGQKDLLENG